MSTISHIRAAKSTTYVFVPSAEPRALNSRRTLWAACILLAMLAFVAGFFYPHSTEVLEARTEVLEARPQLLFTVQATHANWTSWVNKSESCLQTLPGSDLGSTTTVSTCQYYVLVMTGLNATTWTDQPYHTRQVWPPAAVAAMFWHAPTWRPNAWYHAHTSGSYEVIIHAASHRNNSLAFLVEVFDKTDNPIPPNQTDAVFVIDNAEAVKKTDVQKAKEREAGDSTRDKAGNWVSRVSESSTDVPAGAEPWYELATLVGFIGL